VSYLPWFPSDRPVGPPVATAWFCARFTTLFWLVVLAVLYVFVPQFAPRNKNLAARDRVLRQKY
jgi:hypothetical protein